MKKDVEYCLNELDHLVSYVHGHVEELRRKIENSGGMTDYKGWSYIIIHHSLTKDSETISWNAIRKYHIRTKGWRDIGYHFGVELIRNSYEILYGRSLLRAGAHTTGMNINSIGICCVGDYDVIPPPERMYDKLAFLVKDLMEIFSIPVENVKGHSDYAEKSCPGDSFDMDKLRSLL